MVQKKSMGVEVGLGEGTLGRRPSVLLPSIENTRMGLFLAYNLLIY